MLKLKKLAVTGGLAVGKSSVCQILEEEGAYVVNADEIVHQLLSLNTIIGQQVVSLLGPDVITDGQIDRKKIAEKVFSSPDRLQALEKIIHPAVLDEIEKHYQKIKQTKTPSYFVVEIPLLYEIGAADRFDAVVAVVADPSLAKKRFTTKTGYSEEEYDKRMKFQLSQDAKAQKADFIIVNNGNLIDLKNHVHSLLKELRSR